MTKESPMYNEEFQILIEQFFAIKWIVDHIKYPIKALNLNLKMLEWGRLDISITNT